MTATEPQRVPPGRCGGWLWASTAARWILAAVWLAAGLSKVTDLDGSAKAVAAFQILPPDAAIYVGYALPMLEIGLGVLLAAGVGVRVSAAVSALLMAAFTAGIVSVWMRGLSIDCGCFGGGGEVAPGETNYAVDVARDVALLVLSGLLVWRPQSRLALSRA